MKPMGEISVCVEGTAWTMVWCENTWCENNWKEDREENVAQMFIKGILEV